MGSTTSFITGGLIDPSVPGYGSAAKQNNRLHQLALSQGLADINSVFGGGTVPGWQLATGSYDPKQNYFINKGGAFSPWHVGNKNTYAGGDLVRIGNWFAGGAAGPLAPIVTAGFGSLFGGSQKPDYQALYNKDLSQGRNDLYIMGDPKSYQGFSQDFFNNAGNAYTKFATPQLANQTKNTKDEILYGLANRGLSQSGAQNKALSDLGLQVGQQQQAISDQSRTIANNLKTQVEAARQNAINQLYQTGDPSQALQSSITAAAGFQVPQAFAPLANAFGGLLNQYASNLLYNPPAASQSVNPYTNYFQQTNTPNQAGVLGNTVSYT